MREASASSPSMCEDLRVATTRGDSELKCCAQTLENTLSAAFCREACLGPSRMRTRSGFRHLFRHLCVSLQFIVAVAVHRYRLAHEWRLD